MSTNPTIHLKPNDVPNALIPLSLLYQLKIHPLKVDLIPIKGYFIRLTKIPLKLMN